MEIPIQIDVSGESVLGVMHLPNQKAKGSPVAIMFYGFNGERVDNNRISVLCGRRAEECGVTYVRFDYRGLGLSEGEFWNTSLDTKLEDAVAVIESVKELLGPDISIIALGFSDGVRIVTRLMKVCPDIKGLCLWSPVLFSITDEVHGKIRRKFYREPTTKQLVSQHRGLWVGQQYLRQLSATDHEFDSITDSNKQIVAIFGGNDPTIRETQSELHRLAETGSDNIHAILIPDADHLFSEAKWIDQIIGETVRWALEIGASEIM